MEIKTSFIHGNRSGHLKTELKSQMHANWQKTRTNASASEGTI